MGVDKHDSNRHHLKHAVEGAEHHVELPSSAIEMMSIAAETDSSGAEGSETSTFEALHTLPILGDFIRSINFILQGINAIANPETPQRKTKIAAGLFGGFVSVGTGIVGALALAGVGLLATSAALFIVPIVLPAAVSGIYATALYRDIYSYYQLKNQLKKIEAIEKTWRPHWKASKDKASISAMDTAKTKLTEKIDKARWKALTSAAYMVGFALVMGAVLATGVGAVAIAAVSCTLIVGATAKRMYDNKQDLKKAALIIGVTLLFAAAFATGIGAIIISSIGLCFFLGSILTATLNSKQTANTTVSHVEEDKPKHFHVSNTDIYHSLDTRPQLSVEESVAPSGPQGEGSSIQDENELHKKKEKKEEEKKEIQIEKEEEGGDDEDPGESTPNNINRIH